MIFGRMVFMETTCKNTASVFFQGKGNSVGRNFVRVHEFQKICGNKVREQERLKSKKVGLMKQIPVGDRD